MAGAALSRRFVLGGILLGALAACGCSEAHQRFGQSFDSPASLARAFLAALEARDAGRLRELPLTEQEFVREVYPELPAHGKIPADFIWGDLRQKSASELKAILHYHGGKRYELEQVSFDGGATAYASLVVHRKPRLRVRDRASGERKELALFGSVLQHGPRYKLFSYVVGR